MNETKNFKKIILIVFTGGNTRFITALIDFYRYQLSTFYSLMCRGSVLACVEIPLHTFSDFY